MQDLVRPKTCPYVSRRVSSVNESVPHVGRFRVGRALTLALYAVLVSSAALALWVRQFPGRIDGRVEAFAPWVFLAFAVGFAVYRLALVRAGKYPAAKALFQIGVAVLFFMLLLPWSKGRYDVPADPLLALMSDPNPQVRALAAEVARHRPDGEKYASRLVEALQDPDANVRRQAHESLVRLTGRDLGAPGEVGALEAWRARYP